MPVRAKRTTLAQALGDETLWIPVSHGNGNYQAPADTLKELEATARWRLNTWKM